MLNAVSKPTGMLPRVVTESLLWTGGCLSIDYYGQTVFGHFSVYLVKGRDKTILIDTGHPIHWPQLERDVERFLDGRSLDYVFPTHAELPHSGLLPKWLEKYPDAVAIGDLRDYDLYYPHLVHRFRTVTVGDHVDLGDRRFTFVPAVWRDVPTTLWAFEDGDRTLFVSDAFAYLHYHHPGETDFLTSEAPPPDLRMIQFFNERALQWTRFTDVEATFADLDALLDVLDPAMIAPSHGGVIDEPDKMTPLVKHGMSSKASPPAA